MNRLTRTRVVASTAALLLALTAAGCGGSDDAGSQDTGADNKAFSVVAPLSGQLGDKSFMDSADRGLKQAQKELGVSVKVIEASSNDAPAWERNLRQAGGGDANLIVTGGTVVASTLKKVAPAFPKKQFLIFDAPSQGSNSTGITYAQNEGAYLAGALAAMITTNPSKFPKAKGTKIVGLCAGMDIPVIRDFIAGFRQGVKDVDPTVKVDVRFTGDFVSPQKGYDTTSAMMKAGADVVYQVAGPTGLGVLKAAAEAGRYGIGTDSDQNALHPGFIAGSAIKSVDNTVFAAVKDAKDGNLKMGETRVGNLANNGVNFSFASFVPADVKTKIEGMKKKIVDGETKVDTVLGK